LSIRFGNSFIETEFSKKWLGELMAIMSLIDYVFDDSLYIDILKDVKNYPIDDFLLSSVSVYNINFKQ